MLWQILRGLWGGISRNSPGNGAAEGARRSRAPGRHRAGCETVYMWWRVAAAVAVAVLALWVLLALALWIARPGARDLKQALRLLPDVLRLVSRLARDRTIARRTRAWLWALLAYLALPIDLIPDFVPVIGYADDAIILILVLRVVVHRVGAEPLRRNWLGTADGLATVTALAGLPLDSGRSTN